MSDLWLQNQNSFLGPFKHIEDCDSYWLADENTIYKHVLENADVVTTANRRKYNPFVDSEGKLWTEEMQEQVDLEKEKASKFSETSNEIVHQVQLRLDAFAKTKNYDGILSACTYATSINPKFKAEGQYCVEARDNTWAILYQILEDVQAGIRPAPSAYQDIESELPILAWSS